MKRLFINTLILTISISCFGMTPDRNNDKTVKRTVVTTKTTTSKNTHFGRKPTTTVTKTVVTRPGNTVGHETCCKNNKKSCMDCKNVISAQRSTHAMTTSITKKAYARGAD